MHIPDINRTLEEAMNNPCTHPNKVNTTGPSVSDPAWIALRYCKSCGEFFSGTKFEGFVKNILVSHKRFINKLITSKVWGKNDY